MSQIVSDMKKIYRLKGYDFMGYTFRTIGDLSYHHIHKQCDGGDKTLENGALLNKYNSHPYLHIIEGKDYEIYYCINAILKQITEQQHHPTKEQLKAIRELLLTFESEHMRDVNSKGKVLIKYSFIKERIDL